MPLPPEIEDIARVLGAHALIAFGLALVAVLASTAALWWALQRHGLPRARSGLPPFAFLLLQLALGFAVIVGAALVFAEIADELDATEELGPFDQAVSDAIGRSTPIGVVQAFAWVTRLGDPSMLVALAVIVALLLVWRGQRVLALGWVVALGGNAVLNPALKGVFARVRPVHEGGLVAEEGFSFPSGHSSGSVVSYGMLAYVAVRLLPARWHLPAVLAATAVAFTVASSRVFLRVHFPSDVVAGAASGLAWLTVCIVSIELSRWYRQTRA
jgi:membrane-associated phospholipid phosphatase